MQRKRVFVLLAILTGMAAGVRAQEKTGAMAPAPAPWYVGIQGGTSFGQCTFWSINQEGVRSWGIQGGLFGGYKFNRLISMEAGIQYGGQSQFNLECCPYWLSVTGDWKATQVIDQEGWYYSDLEAATRWSKLSLQANFNMLSFIKSNNHWSLDISPQISLVNTRTTWKGELSKSREYHQEAQAPNWHLGLGGQVGAGYAFNDNWKLGIYGGITALTGKRFDVIPNKYHNTNIIWDAGIKLAYSFGGSKKKKAQAEAELAAAQEAARLAAEQEAARLAAEQEAAEQTAKEKAAREAAEKAAAEKAAKEAAESAAAAEAAKYYHGTFQNIYFADNSTVIGDQSAKLDEVAAILEQYPNTVIALYGYASKSGEEDYNLYITNKRVEKVKAYLVEKGIDASRINPIEGKGVDQQAKRYKDARRVEIVVAEK